MARFTKQTELGFHWMGCGWRLFKRNPWLLGGMGFGGAVIITFLSMLPLLGAAVLAFMAPIVLASYYLAIDRMSKTRVPMPMVRRSAVLKQSGRELFGVFRDENRIVPIVILSLYAMVVSLLTNAFIWLIAGSAWTKPLTSLNAHGVAAVIAAILLALIIYFLLAISIVYALPRTFLRGKPLVPEMGRSIRAGVHYLFALLTILGLLLVPILLGLAASAISAWLTYAVVLLAYTILLPQVACSLYCSYRTLFQPKPVARG